jgi:hypothetical protein
MSGVVTIVCISHQVTQWFQSRPVILQFAHPRWGICKAGKAEILNMRVRVSSKVSTVLQQCTCELA